MNDERFLKDWLRDTTDSAADPSAAGDKVVARIPETSQRHRWLPWPPTRRPNPDKPDGRTRFMFSPVKTIAGAALVAIVGTSLLISAPLQDGPNAPSGAAELEPALVSVITGTIVESTSPSDDTGTLVTENGVVRTEGIHFTNVWDTTDPRLSGTATYDAEWISFPQDDLQIEASFHVVENDEGRWVGSGTALVNRPTLAENTDVAILRGEGAYEGLTAYVQMDWTSLPAKIEAAIFPGEMPVTKPLKD